MYIDNIVCLQELTCGDGSGHVTLLPCLGIASDQS